MRAETIKPTAQLRSSIGFLAVSENTEASLFSHLAQPHHAEQDATKKKSLTTQTGVKCFLFNSKAPVSSDVNFLIDVWLIKHHPDFLLVCVCASEQPSLSSGRLMSNVPLREGPEHIFLIEMVKLWLVLPSRSRNCRLRCSSPLPNVSESLSPARLPLIPICVGGGSGEAELSITADESCRHNNSSGEPKLARRNSHWFRRGGTLSSVLPDPRLLPPHPRGFNHPDTSCP